jgi:hypothetical protein
MTRDSDRAITVYGCVLAAVLAVLVGTHFATFAYAVSLLAR